MSRIFSNDYDLTPKWSAELIYLENSPRVDTEIHSSRRSDVIGALVSCWEMSRVIAFFNEGFRFL